MKSLIFGLMSALRILFQSQAPKYRKTTFSKISSAHWYMMMTPLSSIMHIYITIHDK